MRKMDAASEKRLIEAVSYLKKISKDALMARLYQKILFLLELKNIINNIQDRLSV